MVLSGQNLRSHSLCQSPAMHAPPDGKAREASDSARCCSSSGINSLSMLLEGTRPIGRYKSTRDGTRAHNLLLRGEAPYPLGHTSNCCSLSEAIITCASPECVARVRRCFMFPWILNALSLDHDSVSERLRRWTRNPLGSARRGSNPLAVA